MNVRWRVTTLLGTIAMIAAAGCTIREVSRPPMARGYVAVGTGQTYTVRGYPPAPLRETIPESPGEGYVWIDGYWHWYGSEWQWRPGQWVVNRPGFVYISPYYDYGYRGYIYRTGYWMRRHQIHRNVYVHRPPGQRPLTGYARRSRRLQPNTAPRSYRGPRAPATRRYPGRFRPPKRGPASTNRGRTKN